MKYFLTFLLVIAYCYSSYSQTKFKIVEEKYFYKSKIPQFIAFSENSKLEIENITNFFLEQYNLSIELNELKRSEDKLGFTHYKYQQHFKGNSVELGIVNVHVKNGCISSINGSLVDQIN